MKLIQLTAAALILSAGGAFADTHITNGTVTKIDTQWSKVTLDHEELKNLDMPAMKMVFQVAEPEMLEGLSEGQWSAFIDTLYGQMHSPRSLRMFGS